MPEIVDVLLPAPIPPTTLTPDPEILVGRRAFAAAQAIFAGAPLGLPALIDVGWHDSKVSVERGSFAVIGQNSGLDDLIGEIVSVTAADRTAFVYVLAAADVPVSLSLARRAFFAICRPTLESVLCKVVAVQ